MEGTTCVILLQRGDSTSHSHFPQLCQAEKRLDGVKLIYKVHRKNVVYFVCAFEDSVQVPTVVLLTSDAVLWVAPYLNYTLSSTRWRLSTK